QATPPEWLQIGLYFLAVETQKIQPGHDKIIDHLV
ncbi:AraC family transcriptional regulator, partial [Acinetobacter baumannii]|nr:AraC family transcriptional regulator [Acinetobacter baumannii]